MGLPAGIGGLLFDVDGTLLVGDRPVAGAAEMLARLRESGVPFRVTTNTSRRSRAAVSAALGAAGLAISPEEVLLPAFLARRRIVASGRTRAALLVPAEARADFAGVVEDESAPDWLVLGDMGRGTTWERLNLAFRVLRGGASFLALHRNPSWFAGQQDGWVLDAGAFVAALEFATGVEAEVVGKPSREFFQLALEELGVAARNVLVVGDDPASDGAGAAAAGCRVALVKTGKFRGQESELGGLAPDLVLDSVAELIHSLPASRARTSTVSGDSSSRNRT